MGAKDNAAYSHSLFGHPKGLYVLFLVEMWERFSFYGMRALLVFFLVDRFGFSDSASFVTYGSYTALVDDAVGFLVGVAFVIGVAGISIYAFCCLEGIERRRLFAALMLMLVWVAFVALIEQKGTSLNLFTERLVNRQIGDSGNVQIASSQLQGVMPIMLITLAPLFAALWPLLDRWNLNPSTPAKFSAAILLAAAGYAMIVVGIGRPDAASQVGLSFLVALYVLFALGDLLIAPVGLSAVTSLSPRRISGAMMGLWLLSVAIGSYFAARIAGLVALEPSVAPQHAADTLLTHYGGFFGALAIGALIVGALAMAATPTIRRYMHGLR